MSTLVQVERGAGPVVLGIPHTGTHIPEDVWEALNETGRAKADTDWHVERLYAGLLPEATSVRATVHRYVIDCNRGPEGDSLYPGRNTTGLVPLTDFDGRPIWRKEPDAAEVARRVAAFHAPYHAALSAELERARKAHGVAVLWDCHSIRSHVPYLFEGTLPDMNVGTARGASCAPAVEAAVMQACAGADGFTHVLNGRFTGGWTTRHYGAPTAGMHAVQMELAQSTHLAAEAPPWEYDPGRADRLRPHLAAMLETLERMALSGELT